MQQVNKDDTIDDESVQNDPNVKGALFLVLYFTKPRDSVMYTCLWEQRENDSLIS